MIETNKLVQKVEKVTPRRKGEAEKIGPSETRWKHARIVNEKAIRSRIASFSKIKRKLRNNRETRNLPQRRTAPRDLGNSRVPRDQRIFLTAINVLGDIPVISLRSRHLRGNHAEVMIDTDAQPNVVKRSTLQSDTEINFNYCPNLIGITAIRVETIATTFLYLDDLEAEAKFAVVSDSFSIKTDLLIGVKFCRSSNMVLDFKRDQLIIKDAQIPIGEERTVECRANEMIWIDMSLNTTKSARFTRIYFSEVKMSFQ